MGRSTYTTQAISQTKDLTYEFLHNYLKFFNHDTPAATYTSPDRQIELAMAANAMLDNARKNGDVDFVLHAFRKGRCHLVTKGTSFTFS